MINQIKMGGVVRGIMGFFCGLGWLKMKIQHIGFIYTLQSYSYTTFERGTHNTNETTKLRANFRTLKGSC